MKTVTAILLTMGGLLVVASPASADIITWDGGSTYDWMTGANWSNDATPVSTNTYTIGTTTPRAAEVGATNPTFLGGQLTLAPGGSLTTTLGMSKVQYGGLRLAGGTLTASSSGSVQYKYFRINTAGGLNVADGTTSTIDVQGNSTYWLGISGYEDNLTLIPVSGSGTINKTGVGQFGVSAAVSGNSFAGTLNINGGKVGANTGSNLAWLTNAYVNVNSGGTLGLRGTQTGIDTLNHLTLNGGTLGLGWVTGSGNTLAGNLNIAVNSYFNHTGLILSSTVTGTGNLTFSAASKLSVGAGLNTTDWTGAIAWNSVPNAMFNLNGNDASVAGLSSSGGYGQVFNDMIGGGTKTLTLRPGDGVSYTFTGYLRDNVGGQGTLALLKSGLGTQILSLVAGNPNIHSGGTTVTAGTLQLGTSNDNLGDGTVTVSGGTLAMLTFSDSVGTVTLSGGSITGTTGVLTSTGSFAVQSGSASAILDGAGIVLNKTTAGTVTLSGANTYTGGTNINGGTLTVGHANALGTTGTITVNDGGKLAVAADITFSRTFTLNSGGKIGGNGTFAPSGGVTVGSGAYLDPGFSPGVTSFSTGLTVNGTYLWDLAVLSETGAGTNYDLALVTGGNIAGSNATLSIVFGSDSLKPANDPMDAFWVSPHTWTIIENSGSGTTANPFTTVADQADWSGKGTFTTGLSLDGTDVVLNWQPVPEPATMAFLALGGLSMLGAAIRRRRAA